MRNPFKNYFKPTPKNVQKMAIAVKGICATLAGSAYMSDNRTLTIAILVIGAVANELFNFFADETNSDTPN